MSTSHYDVLIAGTELPGLILGALCAKRGYRVLVVGQGGAPNCYTHGKYTFRRNAELFTGFESSPAVKDVFSELAITMQMRNRPKPFDPYFQVVLPGGRVDVSGKERSYQRELQREFPTEEEAIRSFFQSIRAENETISRFLKENPPLPPEGWSEKREFARLLQAHPRIEEPDLLHDPFAAFPKGHPFRAFVMAPALMTAPFDLESGSLLARLRTIGHVTSGFYHIEGGIDGLRDVFVEKIKQSSCDYRPDISLDALMVKRNKVVEAYVRDRRESLGCNMLICNSDVKRFFQLIPAEHQKERFHHRIHTLQPTHHFFTVNIAVDRAGIPEGMAKHVFIVKDPSKHLEDDNLVVVSRFEGSGSVVLTATCRLKARRFTPDVNFVQEMTHRVVSRLRDSVFPFLDEHVLDVHSPWLTTDPYSGELRFDPDVLAPIYRGYVENTLDASALPVFTDYKNVLVCGSQVFGGLGFEGAFVSALNAFRRINQSVVLKTMLA